MDFPSQTGTSVPEKVRTDYARLLRGAAQAAGLDQGSLLCDGREILNSDLADAALLPALADALAHLKDREVALPLLQPLLTLKSPVARKQVANAIGHLIGEGDGLYGLLSQEEFGRDSGVANWKLDHRVCPIEDLVGVFQQGPRRGPKRHIRCYRRRMAQADS